MPYNPQIGVHADPGSDLYNERVEANRRAGVPSQYIYGGRPGLDTGIADIVNRFMSGQAQMPYNLNLPKYKDMLEEATSGALDMLQGKISQSTVNELTTRAAERGIGTGAGGGIGNSNAALMRLLGTTSEELQGKGRDALRGLVADTPTPEIFNPMSLYVPQFLAGLERGEVDRSNADLENRRRSEHWKDWSSAAPSWTSLGGSSYSPYNYASLAGGGGVGGGGGGGGAAPTITPTTPFMPTEETDLAGKWWNTYGVTPKPKTNTGDFDQEFFNDQMYSDLPYVFRPHED